MARLPSFAVPLAAWLLSPVTTTIPALAADSPVESKYDVIVVGGGPAGLVLARRLSDDPDTKVLVIEAGPLDQHEDFVDVPARAMGAIGTKYDWNMTYQPSEYVNGRAIGIPQGHVVGGGTILNAMIWQRGTIADYANWEEMGATGWGWDGLINSFEKSEIFVPPTEEISAQYDIPIDWSVHDKDAKYGENGVYATYSPWFSPSIPYFLNASAELGIPQIGDPGAGQASGVMFQPRSQVPDEAIRCSARVGYYDPIAEKENISWLFGYKVLRLLFEVDDSGTPTDRISGVEFSACETCDVFTVDATRDVVLAAGAIGTPALLQRSGIGDRTILKKAGVDVLVDNPNVGMGLTDHYFVTTIYSLSGLPNPITTAEAQRLYDEERTGPLSTIGADILLFLSSAQYMSPSRLSSIHAVATAQDPLDYVDPSWPETFKSAYVKQHALLTSHILNPNASTLEIMPNDQAGVIVNISPFSRGAVTISSSSPWSAPAITSGFLHNPLDVLLLVEAVKFTRKLYATAAMSTLAPAPLDPGPSVDTDEEIEDWIRRGGTTIFHPVASCSMGALEDGGAVDPETMLVWGTSNLRVVDSSVMPMTMGGHTQGTVYGVAEKAAGIILAAWKEAE